MKYIQKFILLAVIISLVSAFCLTLSAEEYSGTCGNNVTWNLDTTTGVLEIGGIGAMEYSSVPWGDYRWDIKSVTIANGVTSIGDSAFYVCSRLTSIVIPDSVTSIDDRAFMNCSSLTSITIPDSVTDIGMHAFAFCKNLTSVIIPNSVSYIGYSAFESCSSLTSITIPDSVTLIGDHAFKECSSLESITLPFVGRSSHSDFDFLGYLFGAYVWGDSSKYVPSSLKTVILSDKCTSLGYVAFQGCSSLTSITIPDSVRSIGEHAFAGCSNLLIICNNTSYAATYAKKKGLEAHYYQHTGTQTAIPATCVADGMETYVCNDCTYTYTISNVALGHDYVIHEAKEPTDIEVGWEAYETCLRCEYTTYVEIPAKDFNSDMDGNGSVTLKDALLIVRAILNSTTIENGDVNGDGKISLADVIRVMKLMTK